MINLRTHINASENSDFSHDLEHAVEIRISCFIGKDNFVVSDFVLINRRKLENISTVTIGSHVIEYSTVYKTAPGWLCQSLGEVSCASRFRMKLLSCEEA